MENSKFGILRTTLAAKSDHDRSGNGGVHAEWTKGQTNPNYSRMLQTACEKTNTRYSRITICLRIIGILVQS